MVEMPLPCCCWLMAFFVSFLALNFGSELSELDQHRSGLSGETTTQWKERQIGPTRGNKHHPASDSLEPVTERSRWLQPRDTWMLFVRHANRGDSKRRLKGRAKKAKLQPLGAHGPPGIRRDVRTDAELLHDLKLLVKGMVQQREKLEMPPCDGCEEPEDKEEADTEKGEILTVIPHHSIETRPRSRVEAAFHCRLKNNISVEPRTLLEMKPYDLDDMEESFQRGPSINLTIGHYAAPSTGFYIFSANIHIDHKVDETGDRHTAGHVRVYISTQSQFLYKSRLETVANLGSSSSLFTLTVSGILFLQAGDYVSIFVENTAGSSLTVLSGSHFSGLLLGS